MTFFTNIGAGFSNLKRQVVTEPEGRIKKTPVYALSLDGVSGSVKVNATASINSLTTISIYAKFKARSAGESNLGTLFQKSVGTTTPRRVRIDSNNKLVYEENFDTDGIWRSPTGTITLTILGIAVVTYDCSGGSPENANPIIYYNSVSQTITETQTPLGALSLDSTNDLYIGNNRNDSATFDGLIYELAYYNVILTSTQAANLSNGSIKPNDISGCVLYHDYTTGSAQDLSGNSNHGTLQGNAQFIIDS